MIYLSGHGSNRRDTCSFNTSDRKYLPFQSLLNALSKTKATKLAIIDGCSKDCLEDLFKKENEYAENRIFYLLSGSEPRSYEINGLGNALFTKALLDAFDMKNVFPILDDEVEIMTSADINPKDGVISYIELHYFLQRRMDYIRLKYKSTYTQTPAFDDIILEQFPNTPIYIQPKE